MRRGPRWIAPLLALMLVALLVGAVVAATRQGDDESRSDGGAETAPADAPGSGTADAQAPDETGATAELAETLLTPPPEFVRLADDNIGTGPLHADRAPALDGFGGLSPAELTSLGLEAGHSRAWQSDAAVLLAIAYEFGDDAGATDFVEQAAAAREADARYERTPVEQVPEAVVLRSTAESDETSIILLPQGPRAYVLGLSRTAGGPAGGVVGDLAARQRDAAGG